MQRRTKIVATLGPASDSPEMIARLLDNGVNVFRLNFSHGDADSHRRRAAMVREAQRERQCYAALLGDLQGPKIRIGDIPDEPRTLIEGDSLVLSAEARSDEQRIPVHYPPLAHAVGPGDTLLLDDGLIQLRVQKVAGGDVHCEVLSGGALKSRKGLNRLGGGLAADAITDKDRRDIELALELELDYLAVSFPAAARDLQPVRDQLAAAGADIAVIAKIERAEAVADDETLIELVQASDGVMVARGDLGVEIGDAQLIGVQKKIIRLARRYCRPVITATQMMETMVHSPVPTRAEVFDVANAVLDGTDAVMLSAETAAGKYPAQVVAAMAKTCIGAEQTYHVDRTVYRQEETLQRIDQAIAQAAIYAADNLDNVGALICLTESGRTALAMSRFRSGLPIYALSRHYRICNRMCLYRGVEPMYADFDSSDASNPYTMALELVGKKGLLRSGERVTITCGDLANVPGVTNTLKVLEYDAADR